MTDIAKMIQEGAGHAWLYIPTAIILGALHGLEPGHSKTMMAAFIIAVRGTILQAVLLGLSAAFSHSLIIWLLAALALHYGSQWNAEETEPYFQLASAIIIAALALWMFWRTQRDVHASSAHAHHDHDHDHDHDHGHQHGAHGGTVINTGHGIVELSVFETGVPPVFRLHFSDHGKPVPPPDANSVTIEITRPDGARQLFKFAKKDGFLESTTDIPEPHEFDATLTLAHGDHAHTYTTPFREDAHHHHHHDLDPDGDNYEDAHERAHAQEIEKRFASRQVTTGQIILFGLSGGLLPCPAAFSIVLICMQLKQFTLGIAMVLAFSVGLALTLVATGTLAAWSLRHAERKFKGFGKIARRAPYISSFFLLIIAVYMGIQGWQGIHR